MLIKNTNKLIHESSPYLLQHAHNPVNWYPWGEEALEIARKENKLLLISIGYSACHWCHVMEKESFENDEIAAIMNAGYVCIKVDREEHPDIDHIYMNAVHLMNGRGGWPLNCIALPDTRPVFGGTYFRPDDWRTILADIAEQFKWNQAKFLEVAERIQQGMVQSDLFFFKTEHDESKLESLQKSISTLERHFDTEEGGFTVSPKFPMPSFWQFLQDYNFYVKNPNIEKHLDLTLCKIRKGGIYDHIGGGFSRYSTDRFWKVPHFEKMLYDNAQLVSLYALAFKRSGNALFLQTVTQTLDFVLNEMTSDVGAFYSSYDADSEGVEGKYYLWEKNEIDRLLGDFGSLYSDFYQVNPEGNWEDSLNILFETDQIESMTLKYGLSEDSIRLKLTELNSILYVERQKRVKPGLDDKILTSWNAMMVTGFLDAYEVTGTERYLLQAEKTIEFILSKLTNDHALKRSYKKGKASINGFLDDYAFTIEALIRLFQVTGKESFIHLSKQMADYVKLHFFDPKTGFYFYTSDLDRTVVIRPKEISDNVIPSSNSVMAKNLRILGTVYSDNDFIKQSERMLQNIGEAMLNNLEYYGHWASIKLKNEFPSYEVVVIGNNYQLMLKKLKTSYRPDVFYAGSHQESSLPIFKNRFAKGKTLIYVCKNKVCGLPVETVEEAELLLR